MNIKKRILSALMTVAMFATIVSTTAFAGTEPTITVSSPTATVGTSVDVTVSLENNPGIVSMLLSVEYNKEVLTLTKVTDAGVLGAQSHSNDLALNPYILYWSNGTATSNYTPNGTVATLSFDVAAGAKAGDYPITVSYDKDNDGIFNVDFTGVEFTTVNGKVTVQEKPKQNITDVTLSDKTFTYDGTEKSITVAGTLPTGAKVEYTDNKGTDAGTYYTTAVVSADEYNDLTLNAVMTISPKALTVAGLTASNKEYDGTKDAVISGGTLSGKVSGDDVTAVMPTKGTFANANAGSNVAVSIADIALSGTKAKNYTLTQPSGLKANITAAPITVTADSFTIVKGGTIPALTYRITNGKLIGTDTLSGTLVTNTNTSRIGTYDITQGALKASSNYSLQFVKGTISVVDKTPQDIIVSDITTKTFGDGSFKVTATPDSVSKLNTFTYTSSNPNVAEIAADGTVTIKNAGKTTITVAQAGNDTYAPFTKAQELNVNKVKINVTADTKTKKTGASDPELTYTFTGNLLGTDKFTGVLSRTPGETVGKYDILQGTLTITNNYDITYNKAIFEIVDKTPQNITVGEIAEKTYGDTPFKLEVTPDANSKLNAFTYTSSNTDVAEVAADGTITLKAVGEADITVKEAGNAEFAPVEITKKIVVKKKNIEINKDTFSLTEKKADLVGVLNDDATLVAIDFDLITTKVNAENLKATISGLALKGEKAGNYNLTTEPFDVTVTTSPLEVPTQENVTLTAKKVEGTKTVIIDTIDTASVTSDASSALSIDLTSVGSVDTVSIPKNAFTDLKDKAALEVKLCQGSVTFDKETLAGLEGQLGSTVSLNVEKVADNELTTQQIEKKKDLSNVVVFKFELNSNNAAITENFAGNVTVEANFDYSGSDNVVVKLLKADGTVENVTASYDKTTKKVKLTLKHFSEYLIYTEPVAPRRSSGGSVSSYYILTFNSNGGSKVISVKVKRNEIAAEPTAPTKDGFTFDGWYTDSKFTAKYDFSGKTTKSTTLYAKWTEKPADNSKNELVLTIGKKEAKVWGEDKANDVSPKIVNDRTMLPARFIAEALGATVTWTEDDPDKVVITKGDIEIIITIGSDKALVNGKEITLDSPAFIENDRTYTPIRFISEELGAKVTWNEENETVTITK